MRKRLLSVLLAVGFAAAVVTGCKKNVGTPEDNAVTESDDDKESAEKEESGYLFGYSGIDTGNPYFETLELSVRTELEAQGHRLMSRNSQSDAQLQNEQIRELIDAGVCAVFLCPADSEQITEGLETLDEAGIPVINMDTQVKENSLTEAFVGSDNKNAGFVCGEDLKVRSPNGGKVIILECSSRNSVNQRITGFEESIANSGFEVLNRADVGGDREKAKAEMKKFLEEYPEIDAVMCGNDPIALGALEAVEEADRKNILIYGVDGSPEVKQKLAANNLSLVGTGAQSPINIGKSAVETALAILNGDSFENEIYEKTFLITRDNVELYGTDGWQ